MGAFYLPTMAACASPSAPTSGPPSPTTSRPRSRSGATRSSWWGRGGPGPDVGGGVGEAVGGGGAEAGVVCCWTGTGVSMAANKVPGVRAALCTDAATAAGARRWNDANVLALGLRLTSPAVADEVVDAFLATEVEADEVPNIATLG